ncbi:MAG: DUF2190 family protein [Phycisphaeraceae bacterium]|nr:DUF2190 family protein [Phycisphaeraceae bacterium]
MALATFIHEGRSIDYTPGTDVAAGAVVVQGELVGIAKLDIKANTLGALAVAGVFDITKATGAGTAITAGAFVHWDATNSIATTADGGGANKRIGKAVAAAATTDAKVRVRLSQ